MNDVKHFNNWRPNKGGQQSAYLYCYQKLWDNEPVSVDLRGGLGSGKNATTAKICVDAFKFYSARYGKLSNKPLLFNLLGERHTDIREVMLYDLLAVLDDDKIPYKFTQKPVIIKIPSLNIKVEGFSAKDPQSIKGRNSFGYWCDEAYLYERPEAIEKVDDRCRFGGDKVPKFKIFSNTPEPSTTIPQKDKLNLKTFTIPTIENIEYVGKTYIDNQMAKYTEEEIRCYIYGEEVKILSNLIYYAFDVESCTIKDTHELARYDYNLDFVVGMDFNVNPFCAHIGQLHNYLGKNVLVWKKSFEIKVADIDEMIKEVNKEILSESNGRVVNVVCYPDSNKGRDTGSILNKKWANEYEKMTLAGWQVDKYKKNPNITFRVSLVNNVLKNKQLLIVDNSSTKNLISKYNSLKWAKVANEHVLGVMPKDNHTTDASDYAIIKIFETDNIKTRRYVVKRSR